MDCALHAVYCRPVRLGAYSMRARKVLAQCLVVVACGVGTTLAVTEPTAVFLLDRYGLLFRGAADGTLLRPMGRSWLDEPVACDVTIVDGGIYILTEMGEIHRSGYARPLASIPFGINLARDLEYLAADDTFYLLDGYGGLYALGERARPEPRLMSYRGENTACDLEPSPDGSRLFVLDTWGRITVWDEIAPVWDLGLPQPLAVAFELVADGSATVLLADGRVFLLPEGSNTAQLLDSPFFGAPIAVDLALDPGRLGGYVLDQYGGIHSFGGAPPIAGTSAPLDVAAALEVVAAAMAAPPPRAASGPVASVWIETPTIPYWQEAVRVGVRIESASDVAGFSANLTYRSELLSPLLETAQAGEFLTALGQPAQVLPPTQVQPGQINVLGKSSAATPGSGSSGDGLLFTMAFSPQPLAVTPAQGNFSTLIRLESLVCTDTQLVPHLLPAERCQPAILTLVYTPPSVGLALGDALEATIREATVAIGDHLQIALVAHDLALVRGCAFDLEWTRICLEERRFVEGPLFRSAGPTATLFVPTTLANALGARTEHAVSLLGHGSGVRGHGVIARAEYVARQIGRAVIRFREAQLAGPDGTLFTVEHIRPREITIYILDRRNARP